MSGRSHGGLLGGAAAAAAVAAAVRQQQLAAQGAWQQAPGSPPGGAASALLGGDQREASGPRGPDAGAAAASSAAAAPAEEAEPEVPRCHLHRKLNKACKFCKAHQAAQEVRTKKIEEQKSAALERLLGSSAAAARGEHPDDRAPVPNLGAFPHVLLDRIHKSDYYNVLACSYGLSDLKKIIAEQEACDVEARTASSMDLEPSRFICCVYRMLVMQLTEGQLRKVLRDPSCFVRCAGFLYVRIGMHHERYWELLSDSLMDFEEFVPFPGRSADAMTIGQLAEALLTKDKYCDMNLPRIPITTRKTINRRILLYSQFRKRFDANLEVLDRFQEAGVPVEVCSADGDWSAGETVDGVRPGRPCKSLRVSLASGGEPVDVSLGMVICPGGRQAADPSDLTRCRGRSAEELLEKFEAQQKDTAVAKGKDYCKTSGQHTLRVGGVPFVAGVKRKEREPSEPERPSIEGESTRRSGPSLEHQAKLAAIESKYLARVRGPQGGSNSGVDGPERMRLG